MAMNRVNRIQQSGIDAGTKGFVAGCVGLWVAALVASAPGAQPAASEQDACAACARQNDLLIASMPTTPAARQLWQARISVSQNETPSSDKEALEQIIRHIKAIQFSPSPAAEPKVQAAAAVKTEPNEIAAAVNPMPTVDRAENKLPDGFVSEQTVRLFNRRPETAAMENPLQMAEILFSSGRLKEAAVFYRQALDRFYGKTPDPLEDKAWVLLQLGNCLQKDDPQAALESYKRLLAECPGSMWTELAKAQSQRVQWYLQDQPKTLVKAAP